MPIRVSALIPAVAAAATLAVTGCGSGTSAKTSPQGSASASATATPGAAALFSKAQQALSAATSVRVSGSVTSNGAVVGMDISLTKSGRIYGTLKEQGQQITVLITGGESYAKVSAGFLKAHKLPSSACVLMCGKWLKLSGADAKGMVGDLSWSSLLGSYGKGAPPGLAVTGTVTIRGIPAWVLKGSDGTILDVAAQGTPYPLRITGSGQPGGFDFSNWNSVSIPGTPPASQVIDTSQMGG